MAERFSVLRSRNSSEQQQHELAVVDAAVRGAATTRPEDAALTDFALRMSAARELPSDGFYRELDERFAASEAKLSGKPPRRRFNSLATGAGALAGFLAVVVIAVGINSRGTGDTSNSAMSDAAAPAVAQSAEAPDTGTSIEKVQAPSTPARKVSRTAELALATPGNNVETIADGVIHITDRFGGFIGDSTVVGGDAGNANARFEIQVPADKFQPALAEMSKLAHVRSRVQSTQDVTAPYSRARSRLAVARAQRDRLVEQLAAAEPGSSEAAAIKSRLAKAEAHTAASAAALKKLQNKVNYVGLGVEVIADGSAAADDRGAMKRAFDTAAKILTSIAAVLVIILAIALPVALLTGLIWVLVSRGIRRRRNATLDELTS